MRAPMMIAALLIATCTAGAQEPSGTDGWVVLPVEEYRDLRARAFPRPPDPAPPPVDSVLSRLEYDLRVSGDVVSGVARLGVDVLAPGWVSVHVPHGLVVRGAQLDGRAATLVPGTPPRLRIAQAGRSIVTLDLVVPVASRDGVDSLTLPPAPAAISLVRFALPRTDVDLSVSSGLIVEREETSAESRWTVHATAAPLTLSWRQRVEDRRSGLPLRTRARITQMVALGEETSTVTARIETEILQGAARQIDLIVPDGVAINAVTGATVADWSQAADALIVQLLEPVNSRVEVVVNGEARLPRDGAVPIPLLRVRGAERESGGLAVDVIGAGEIGARQASGFEPADPTELGGMVSGRESASMAAFRLTPLANGDPRSLTVDLTRYAPRAVLIANVDEARYDAVVGEDGKMLVRARYAVRNNQRSFLAVTLPDGAIPWSARLAGEPVRPGVGPSGTMLLPLRKGRTGQDAPAFAVELVYLHRAPAWGRNGRARLQLPALDLPVSRTGVALHHSPRYHLELQTGSFRNEIDPGPAAPVLRDPASLAALPPPAPPPPAAPIGGGSAGGSAQLLIDQLLKDGARGLPGLIPVQVSLPEFGVPFFVAAELTAEGWSPIIELDYRRNGDR